MKYQISIDKKVLLQVGNLNKRKNHIVVLNAIKDMDESLREKITYIIVGEGSEKESLVEFVTKNKLNKYVSFRGRVDDKELVDIYHLSDFFILPSTSEGLPLVFLEAMASGLPVITFKDLEGVSDVYNPECMELIEERSVDNIIKIISKSICKEWDAEKIINYANNWNWINVCDKYLAQYNKIIICNLN